MRIYNSSLFLLKQFEKLVPEKIKDHSLAVAKRCHQLALREKASSEVLFFAGLFHDIGKSSSFKKSGFHPLDGADYMISIKEPDLAHLVARHSTSPIEARLLGISLGIWSEDIFPQEQIILDVIDLTTSKSGYIISFEERLEDIERRYGKHSIEVQSLGLLGKERLELLKRQLG